MKPEQVYRHLRHFSEAGNDQFSLLIVKSQYEEVHKAWQARLEVDLAGHNIRLVKVTARDLSAVSEHGIQSLLEPQAPKSGLWVLSLSQLESLTQTIDIPSPLIRRFNVERDDLIQRLLGPIILWVSPATVRQLAEFAPDFYDFRQAVLTLPEPERQEYQSSPMFIQPQAIERPEPISTQAYVQLQSKVETLREVVQAHPEQAYPLIQALQELAMHSTNSKHTIELLNEASETAQNFDVQDQKARILVMLAGWEVEFCLEPKAVLHYQKAVAIYRQLSEHNPNTYQIDLAKSLYALANVQAVLKKPAAETAYREARSILQHLRESQIDYHMLVEITNRLNTLLGNQVLCYERNRQDPSPIEANAVGPNADDAAYVNSEMLLKNIQKLHDVPDRPCGLSILRLVRDKAACLKSNEITTIVAWYARYDPDPVEELWRVSATAERQPYGGSPYSHGINTVRGSVCGAIASLLFHKERYQALAPTIERLLNDPSIAVRSCIFEVLTGLLDIDVKQAIVWFNQVITEKSLLDVSGVENFLHYAGYRDFSGIQLVIDRMLCSDQDKAITMASNQVCCLALSVKAAEPYAAKVRTGSPVMRRSAANTYVVCVVNDHYRATALAYLVEYFCDADQDVRSEACKVLRRLSEFTTQEQKCLLEAFNRSSPDP